VAVSQPDVFAGETSESSESCLNHRPAPKTATKHKVLDGNSNTTAKTFVIQYYILQTLRSCHAFKAKLISNPKTHLSPLQGLG
jgi:hypothetical protein